MFAGGTGPNPTEPMSVANAIDEVFGAVRPRPSATAELRVKTWYEATATTMLEQPTDFVSFVHVFLAAAYEFPTTPALQAVMKNVADVFCLRHGVTIGALGKL